MSYQNSDLREATLKKIIIRENKQQLRKSNLLEPLLLYEDTPYQYGRWFVGRDLEGKAIYRSRRAGLNPRFHDHIREPYSDQNNYKTMPLYSFQFPNRGHRKGGREVNTFR